MLINLIGLSTKMTQILINSMILSTKMTQKNYKCWIQKEISEIWTYAIYLKIQCLNHYGIASAMKFMVMILFWISSYDKPIKFINIYMFFRKKKMGPTKYLPKKKSSDKFDEFINKVKWWTTTYRTIMRYTNRLVDKMIDINITTWPYIHKYTMVNFIPSQQREQVMVSYAPNQQRGCIQWMMQSSLYESA